MRSRHTHTTTHHPSKIFHVPSTPHVICFNMYYMRWVKLDTFCFNISFEHFPYNILTGNIELLTVRVCVSIENAFVKIKFSWSIFNKCPLKCLPKRNRKYIFVLYICNVLSFKSIADGLFFRPWYTLHFDGQDIYWFKKI